MRHATSLRRTVFGLLIAVVAVYAGYWWIAAGRVEDSVVAWAQSLRARRVEASWRTIRVAGFPTAIRVEIDGVRLRNLAVRPAPELRVPELSGSTAPWDFRNWRLTAPQGLAAEVATAGIGPPLRAAAQRASGTVRVDPGGGAIVRVALAGASVEAGGRFTAKSVEGSLILPARPPRSDDDRDFTATMRLRQVGLPVAPPPFGDTVSTVALRATMTGSFPGGPPRQAAVAWRDAGGTVELDNFHLLWGALDVRGSGTAALDHNLQPIGAFSGTIRGYDQLVAALVATGRLPRKSAALVRLALAFLAKPGPDGKPQIATSFTIQNGEMFLGPAKLGPAPRITW